ncbi:hypothetical protein [Citrobacter portucalensis]|uniref:hypothetical protein n=1 Tax=Citrobacter portucalensis TaxID=1639133 RepID=UPI0022432FF2|nr:hypothetical protein [Citrobacter portucalensis]MCW8352428.1 hypothetical protein [Citrobacter portucalensis]MCX9042258.1 hypothetical protein [Citrobacter portucalensis]MCX9051955.1 hypothetical protein [Citrobacter portucalensis]
MSDFDSLFDGAMQHADQVIMERMSVSYQLQLKNGSTLDIRAIYDTQLQPATGNNSGTNPRNIDAAYENGLLTVLGARLDRDLIHGATVLTKFGVKTIAQVLYPDATTTTMVLAMPTGGELPTGNGVRFTK